MKGILIYLILVISLTSLTSAMVSFEQNPISITLTTGTSDSYDLKIINDFDFDVYDFEFEGLSNLGFSFPSNTTVQKNSSRTFSFDVSPTDSIIETIERNIRFHFNAEIPTEITTYTINIGEDGFSEEFIILRSGDTITWKNTDTIFHTLFSQDFNKELLPNETFSFAFNELGEFDYVDPSWNAFPSFHGKVNVISRTSTEKVFNPSHDFPWTLNLEFKSNPTNLTMEIEDNNITLGANSKTEGRIKIENNGSEIAEIIELSSESVWITFKENNFNLDPGSTKFVVFEVDPLIFDSDDTNKTYGIDINMKASNVLSQSKTLSVFIPFSDVFDDVTTDAGFFALLDKFCKANPLIYFCNPTNETIGGSGSGGNQTFNINVTGEEFNKVLRDIGIWGTTLIRTGNSLQTFSDSLEIFANDVNTSLSELKEQQEKTEKDRKSDNYLIVFGLFIAFVVWSIMWVTKRVRNSNKIDHLHEGVYSHRGN